MPFPHPPPPKKKKGEEIRRALAKSDVGWKSVSLYSCLNNCHYASCQIAFLMEWINYSPKVYASIIIIINAFEFFLSLGTGKESEESNLLQHLSDACLVVDALEASVREELVNNFCSRELTSYEQIFEGAGSSCLSFFGSIFIFCVRSFMRSVHP